MVYKLLMRSLPPVLYDLFMELWYVPQRKEYHPEGNVLKHSIVVIKRSLAAYPNNINLALAAIFHDIGKLETLMFDENDEPTAHGHEHESADIVNEYRDWIKSIGGDPDIVWFIVKNHMRIKHIDEMRPAKRDALMKHKWFVYIDVFRRLDTKGYY